MNCCMNVDEYILKEINKANDRFCSIKNLYEYKIYQRKQLELELDIIFPKVIESEKELFTIKNKKVPFVFLSLYLHSVDEEEKNKLLESIKSNFFPNIDGFTLIEPHPIAIESMGYNIYFKVGKLDYVLFIPKLESIQTYNYNVLGGIFFILYRYDRKDGTMTNIFSSNEYDEVLHFISSYTSISSECKKLV